MYIHNLLKRTTYSILDLISDQCLDKINKKFNTYYHKRFINGEAHRYANTPSYTYEEYKKIMEEIPKSWHDNL